MNIWKNKKWQPMLLHEENEPFDSKEYIYELKFDGIRSVIFASPTKVIVQTRNKIDVTHLFPELQKLKELVKENTIFDGEIVSFENNKPSFSKLQKRMHLKNIISIKEISKEEPVVFVCFDILYKNEDLTSLTLLKRKNILKQYKDNDIFIKTTYINDNGIELFKKIKKLGLEGIVAKRKNSNYEINTRSYDWIKIKNIKMDEFIVGGYIENKQNTISLILGEKRDNKLYYVGKVVMAKKKELYNKLKNLKEKNSSFVDYNEEEIKYIDPKYTCNIEYLERTKSNHLRHPIFRD